MLADLDLEWIVTGHDFRGLSHGKSLSYELPRKFEIPFGPILSQENPFN